jgi:hypothetical protein
MNAFCVVIVDGWIDCSTVDGRRPSITVCSVTLSETNTRDPTVRVLTVCLFYLAVCNRLKQSLISVRRLTSKRK